MPADLDLFYSRKDPMDPRLGDLVRRVSRDHEDALKSAQIAILGVPEDRGIAANGGKQGAALGPEAIRRAFYKLTPGFGVNFDGLSMIDLGDIPVGETLEETHKALTESVREISSREVFPLVLGGGHDLTYPGLKGLVQGLDLREGQLGLINLDSHLDVRDMSHGITSGTPFRRALTELPNNALLGRSFVEFGIQEPYNSPHYYQWVRDQGSTVFTLASVGTRPMEYFLEASRIACDDTKAVALSIDIDSVRSQEAPGASASNPRGFKAPELEKVAYLAGRTDRIRYLDLMEMSPPLDEHNRTASLCASTLFWFCKGFRERG
ncbi:formimidoylglutamase [Dethiosulfovibrio salsuginis]|uniref:formimidoylglutamase n=1 Tax=Dethiosulfovibrio salsuginis TaxID=561720 RepID=UPI002E0E1235